MALPAFLQEAAVSWQGRVIHGRRYGPEFIKVLGRSRARLDWPDQAIEDYRARQLSGHLKYARHSVFWAGKFSDYGVRVDASDPFSELTKLPILTKEEVRLNFAQILNPLFEKAELIRAHTSGTTGAGLVFYETPESEWERWSVWWRYRQALGLGLGTRCGHFGGRRLISLSRTEPPFWRHSPHTNQIFFSSQHLSAHTFGFYLDEIRRQRLTWLHGYPSTIGLIAEWMIEHGETPPPDLKVITTGAENLSEQQRVSIGRAFGVPVFEHYGLAESTANFSQHPDGKIFVDEDFAGVEFLPTADPEQYAIAGTNWHNHAFPLFRYDCGDFCHPVGAASLVPRGMRSREILAIDGRREDVLVLSNGVRIGRLDHIFKEMVNIREAQITQNVPGEAIFSIVRGADYNELDERQLRREIVQRLGIFCRFHIVYVASIPRTKSGKLRLVVSTLSTLLKA